MTNRPCRFDNAFHRTPENGRLSTLRHLNCHDNIYIYRESGQILSSKREKIADSFRQLMFIVGEISESFETMERLSLSNDFLRLSFPWERVKKETIPTILFVKYRNDVSFIFLFFYRKEMSHES